MGLLTCVLWGLLALFTGGDALAHFTKYRFGETVSASIWWMEKRFPALHIILGALLVVLFTHLEFQLP